MTPRLTSSAGRCYTLRGALGSGGFGTVYRGEREDPGGVRRTFAVKLLQSGTGGRDFGPRLRDEARILSFLDHRGVVSVDCIEKFDDAWAVVMAYVPGQDVKSLMNAGSIDTRAAVEIARGAAEALDSVHSATDPDTGESLQLVHRDVKPSNVRVTPGGNVVLLDFGVARARFREREAETRSTRFDTDGYTAPERFDNDDSSAADVFSLGVVLLECLSGERCGQPPVRPSAFRTHIDKALARIESPAVAELVEHMLSYEPLGRPSADEVAARLRELAPQCEGQWLSEWAATNVGEDTSPLGDNIADELSSLTGAQANVALAQQAAANARTGTRWSLAIAALVVLAVGGGLWTWADRRAETAIGMPAAEAARPHANADMLPLPGRSDIGCEIFPTHHAINTDISTAPLHPHSDEIIAVIGADAALDPVFGREFGYVYQLVDADQRRVPMMLGWSDESDPGPYPLPRDVRVAGAESRQAIVIERGDPCVLWEFIGIDVSESGWRADAAARFPLDTTDRRPDNWTSADGAGLPIFPLLVIYDEVEQGRITHALRFAAWPIAPAFVRPASHAVGSRKPPPEHAPPMGTRLRLRADHDCTSYSAQAAVICAALKQFGMILAERGDSMTLSGAPDPRWNLAQLAELEALRASDFDVIDSGPVINPPWHPSRDK